MMDMRNLVMIARTGNKHMKAEAKAELKRRRDVENEETIEVTQ
jgi:hypothetical protein